MFSRRRFLLTLPALAATPRLAATQSFLAPFRKKPVSPQPVFVYFGTDTAKGISKGIYLSRFDPASGHLTSPQLVAETLRPSFLEHFHLRYIVNSAVTEPGLGVLWCDLG